MPYKYSEKEREQWLRSIYPAYVQQTWHNTPVYHPSHIKHLPYFTRAKTTTERICPKKICGIQYAYHYNCPAYKPKDWRLLWIEFFRSLKRLDWVIDNFNDLDSVINHIHTNKEQKWVMRYGDHYFTRGGQHRLCLAKFLDVEQVEVDVVHFELNKEAFRREMRFLRYLPVLEKLDLIYKDYTTTPEREFFYLETRDNHFVRKELVEPIIRRYRELEKYPYKAFRNKLRTAFSTTENHRSHYIDSIDKLYLLDDQLLKHIRQWKKFRSDAARQN